MIFGNLNTNLEEFFNDRLSAISTWDQMYSKYKNLPCIINSEDGLQFEMPLPGYKKDDILIDIEDSVLTIGSDGVESNSFATAFSKSFKLPDDLDMSTCEAKLEDGILTINFSKKPEEVNKKINVKID